MNRVFFETWKVNSLIFVDNKFKTSLTRLCYVILDCLILATRALLYTFCAVMGD